MAKLSHRMAYKIHHFCPITLSRPTYIVKHVFNLYSPARSQSLLSLMHTLVHIVTLFVHMIWAFELHLNLSFYCDFKNISYRIAQIAQTQFYLISANEYKGLMFCIFVRYQCTFSNIYAVYIVETNLKVCLTCKGKCRYISGLTN